MQQIVTAHAICKRSIHDWWAVDPLANARGTNAAPHWRAGTKTGASRVPKRLWRGTYPPVCVAGETKPSLQSNSFIAETFTLRLMSASKSILMKYVRTYTVLGYGRMRRATDAAQAEY